MTFNYNVTGSERKRLVNAIAELTESKPKYLGMPTAAYEVDYFTIDKNGSVSFDDRADSDEVEQLMERLLELGFEPECTQNSDEVYGLTVSIPRETVPDAAIENLKRMLKAKGTLIKKAISADSTALEVDDKAVHFPWYKTMPDPDMVGAVSKLIGKLLATAKAKKRIVIKAEPREAGNEKYAFRCYLLSLGFIGNEYKNERKILLRNLSGSSAFKRGNPKVQEMVERIDADADLYDDVMSLQDKEDADNE